MALRNLASLHDIQEKINHKKEKHKRHAMSPSASMEPPSFVIKATKGLGILTSVKNSNKKISFSDKVIGLCKNCNRVMPLPSRASLCVLGDWLVGFCLLVFGFCL